MCALCIDASCLHAYMITHEHVPKTNQKMHCVYVYIYTYMQIHIYSYTFVVNVFSCVCVYVYKIT